MKELLESGAVDKIELDKSILVHNYQDFKKTDWGKEKLATFLDRWSRLGFVEGLDEETKERCALAMEQLALYLIYEATEDDNFSGEFEVIGFPIIRRVCAGSVGNRIQLNDKNLFNFNKFIKYCKEFDMGKLTDEITKLVKPTMQIDAEAEACAMASEMIIERFNGNEMPFDELKAKYFEEAKKNIKKRYEGNSSDNTNE